MHATSASVKNNLTAALAYARAGWRIFPCRPGEKRPATEHGVLDATDDEAVIERWWTESPTANVGLSTESLVVIDIDGQDNPWLAGEADKLESLRDAVAQTTPRGKHLIYWMPAGKSWRNSAGKLAERVDVRAGGGYIVAAPSETSDGRYEWIGQGLPANAADLPEPPGWLVEELDRIASGSSSVPATAGEPIPEGRRNATLTSIGGALRRIGLEESAIAAALTEVSRERCKPPLGEGEVRAIASNVAKYEPDQVATALAEGDPGITFSSSEPLFKVANSIADFDQIQEPAALFEGLAFEETFIIAGGDPKAGKTTLALQMALSVLTGAPFLDRKPSKTGPVVLIQADMGEGYFGHVIRQLARGIGIERFPHPIYYRCAADIDLVDASVRKRLTDEIKTLNPALIVADPMRDLHTGNDDKSDELKPVLDFFIKLRNETKSVVLVIDHVVKPREERRGSGPGKPAGYALRGSGAKYGRADSVWIVRDKGGHAEILATHRYGRPPGPILFSRRETSNGGLELVQAGVFSTGLGGMFTGGPVEGAPELPRQERSNAERILSWLVAQGSEDWWSLRAIRDACRLRKDEMRPAIDALLEAGSVEHDEAASSRWKWRATAAARRAEAA